MQDPDRFEEYQRIANFRPSALLQGETPRLIDEWQMAPVLWDAVRSTVDQRRKEGQFILTGSTVVDRSKIMHTGTGRIAQLDMYPMSLFESEESNGKISLEALFFKKSFEGVASDLTVESLAQAICRGGWPSSIGKRERASLLIARSYVDAICESDVSRVDNVTKSSGRVRALLRSYARNISTLATNRTILKDIKANDVFMDESTMYQYLSALKKLFVISEIPAWNPTVRSASAMRSTSKRGSLTLLLPLPH